MLADIWEILFADGCHSSCSSCCSCSSCSCPWSAGCFCHLRHHCRGDSCTCIIENEGFTSLDDLSVLENDTDVTEMAKHLVGYTVADGCINLGTVQIKKLQALVWWVHDEIKHGQALVAADWNVAAVNMAMECKHVDKECELADVGVKDLVKFDLDDFDVHEDAFLDMLAQTCGIQGEPVRHVVHNADVPAAFVDEAEECMCQSPLFGPSFNEDNCTVFCRLKAFLIDSPWMGMDWTLQRDWEWMSSLFGMGKSLQWWRWAEQENAIGKGMHCKLTLQEWAEHVFWMAHGVAHQVSCDIGQGWWWTSLRSSEGWKIAEGYSEFRCRTHGK